MAVDPSLIDYDHIDEPLIMQSDVYETMPSTGWDKVSFMGATVVIPRRAINYNKNGWYGMDAPNKATKEWGDRMVQTMADYTARFIDEFEKAELPKEDH